MANNLYQLYIEKDGVSATYGSGAWIDAVNATGVGGEFRASGVAEEWDTVSFIHVIKETSGGTDFPYYLSGNSSVPANLYTANGYIIGRTGSADGGVRFPGGGFVDIGTNTPYYVKRDTKYDQAAYRVYTCEADSSKHGLTGLSKSGHLGSTGVGRSGSWVSSDHIKVTGGEINTDTGNFSLITSGSGIYINGNVSFSSTIMNRAGVVLASAAEVAADPFISGQRISLLDLNGNMVYPDYRIGADPNFTLTKEERRTIYGAGVNNFGVEFTVVNNNSGSHTTRYFACGNTLNISGIQVLASGVSSLNNSPGNIRINTSGLSGDILLESLSGFNNQVTNTTGATGFLDFQFFWWEDVPSCARPATLSVYVSNTGSNFDLNEGYHIGNFRLNQAQGQHIRLYPNDFGLYNNSSINLNESLFFKFRAASAVGPSSQPPFEVSDLKLEREKITPNAFLNKEGQADLLGDLTVDDEAGGGTVYANYYKGKGDGDRITNQDGVAYLLSGDATSGCCTLQETVDEGNTSTTDIYMNGSSRFYINSYISHVGDTNSYFGFPDNDQFALVAGGHTRMHFTTDGATVYDPLGKSAVEIGKDGYSIQSEDSSIISAYDSSINSTGCLIGGGSGHYISGDWDTIVGGVINDISGGDFCLIGGGSGHCITGSDYSSSVGGYNNDIHSTDAAFIGGGYNNLIESGSLISAIAGGYSGIITDSQFGFVGGGARNHILSGSDGAVIMGGYGNQVEPASNYSVQGGGRVNKLSGQYSFIGGGLSNAVSGAASTILGGRYNEVVADNAVAAGNYSCVKAGHDGAFVFSDGSDVPAISSGANTLGLHFGSGVHIESLSGLFLNGVPVSTGSTTANSFVTGATFGTSDGVLTLQRNDSLADVTVDLDGRFTDNIYADAMNQGVTTTGSPTFNGLIVTGSAGISGGANFIGTGAGNRITAEDGKVYLVSGDINDTDTNTFVTGASFGTSDGVLTLSRNDAATVTVDLDGRFTDNAFADAMNQGVASGDSPTFNSVDITGTSTLTVTGSVKGTGEGNRITNNHVPYLLSGDVTTSSLGLGTAATKDVGISNNNVIQANNTLVDNDFLRIDGTQVEGRSASEVLSDIGGQASLTFGISNTNAVKIDSASVADDEYARFTSAGLESRSTSEVLSDIGLSTSDSPTFNSLIVTGAGGISGGGDFYGTGFENRLTLNGTGYLLSGDAATSLGLGTAATKDVGISNTNVIQANSTLVDNDFLRVDGTQVEGRSASEVLSDIGGQASLTFGISNTNAVKIDSASVADDEYARFTADGLESRSTSEVLSDIGAQASLTFGISNTNAVKIDSASVADDEYARFTANGLESRSTSEVKSDIGLSATDSPTFNGLIATGTAGISGGGDFYGTGFENRLTLNGTGYLLSGDAATSLGLGTAATKDVGISNTNVLQANSTITDDDFLRVDGTQIEGRSASEVLSDIGGQASLTFGISNTNAVKIDSASVADDEYARFTSDGLESRSTSEVLSDIGAQASLTFGISNTNAVKIDSASVADDEYARFTANGLESRSASEVRSDIGLSASDSPTFNGLIVTGAAGISGGANFIGTGAGNRITTENGKVYLVSGDVTTSSLGLGTAATKDVGISNNNVLQANSVVVDNDFLRIDGTQVEGRSASEVLSDIGAQASLTFGISNTNAVKIDSASVADDEYARFTSAGLESRSTSEVLSDIGGVADGGSPTFDSIYLQNTIYHDGDTDTRIDVSADTIQLATAGTTALTVASNSNVGIGTAVPNAAYKLHTQGLAYATGAVIGGSYAGQSPPANGLAIEGKTAIGYYTTSNNLGIYGNASVGTSYITASAPSNGLIVQGDVGIGTQSPATALEVNGAIKGGFNLSEKSADFTLGASDNGNFINGTSTSFDQISISSDLGAGFNVSVLNTGQDVDIVASSSMIVNGVTNGTVTLASGYQPGSIVRLATNTYGVFGNLL
jgi:hypothetical protein